MARVFDLRVIRDVLGYVTAPTTIDASPILAEQTRDIWHRPMSVIERAIAEQMLMTLVGADAEQWVLGGGGGEVWVDGPTREAVLQ